MLAGDGFPGKDDNNNSAGEELPRSLVSFPVPPHDASMDKAETQHAIYENLPNIPIKFYDAKLGRIIRVKISDTCNLQNPHSRPAGAVQKDAKTAVQCSTVRRF